MAELSLPSDPSEALDALRKASHAGPVVVFKFSPICPVSHEVQRHFTSWLEGLDEGARPTVSWIDVVGERPLARGLTAALEVKHESPQALWFTSGELTWHASHHDIKPKSLTDLL